MGHGRAQKRGVDPDKFENVTIREYIDDMSRCMAACDLFINRAGASTLSEIEALGKPSILIPSPYVAENHQYHNAMTLVEKNAAVVIEEKDLTGEKLTEEVEKLLADRAGLDKMGENARAMCVSDAANAYTTACARWSGNRTNHFAYDGTQLLIELRGVRKWKR